MAKTTTSPPESKAVKPEPEFLFIAARREGASRYRLAWGLMTAGGVVAVEKQEECGSLPVLFAAFKRQAVLFLRKRLERA